MKLLKTSLLSIKSIKKIVNQIEYFEMFNVLNKYKIIEIYKTFKSLYSIYHIRYTINNSALYIILHVDLSIIFFLNKVSPNADVCIAGSVENTNIVFICG
tara:strand:- start:8087 stop:8386 length:300 start_codon:yes stop_codon:yes gene_type:complete